MPFDENKIKPPENSPHLVHIKVVVSVHGVLSDGQLHGVPSEPAQALVFNLPAQNRALGKQLMTEAVEKLRLNFGSAS